MPASLNGKALSALMKNGSPLCGAYQSKSCPANQMDCSGRHACTVMKASGRVCGGGHPAMDCRDRKFMKIEEVPAAAELCNAVATPPDGSDPPSHQTNEGHGLLLWGHKALLRNEREQSTMSPRQLHWPSMRRSP
jgi:hypothetical protein